MANKLLGRVDGQIKGGRSLQKGDGQFYVQQKDYREQYYVIAENLTKTEDDIIATAGLPVLGGIYSSAFCTNLTAEEVMRVHHPNTGVLTMLWMVNAEFTSHLDSDQAGNSSDPTDMRPKRRWRSEKEEEVLEKDAITGEPIVTTAGEPIHIKHTVYYIFLEISRYESYPFDPDIINAFVGRANSSSFYGAPTGTVIMDSIESEEEVVNGSVFCHNTYVAKFKMRDDPDSPGNFLSDSFKARPLNNGYLYYPPTELLAATPKTAIKLDKNGQPKRINLDANGFELAATSDPVYLEFNEVSKIDFSALNLEF